MIAVLSPTNYEELYDSIILGTTRSPGVVTLSGHDRKVNWKVNQAQGQKGATMVRSSETPISFTATFKLADDEDFAAWPAFRGLIDSTVSGATPKALDIYHPDLAENQIVSVVKDTTKGTQHDGEGGQIKVVQFIEYFPPTPSGGSPKGSQSKKGPDPNQAALDELAALTKKYQETPWG